MSISPAFLDELRNRFALSGVIGRTVKLTRAGREWKACCPFHHEKTPSFTINDEKGFYHCFGCGAHGDVIRFLTDHEGLAFRDAVERLAMEAGLEIPQESRESREREVRRTGLVDVMEATAQWFRGELGSTSGAEARVYLEKRGLSRSAIETFTLGFAPDSRMRLKVALNSYGMDKLVEGGLLIQPEERDREPYDRFRGRLMFPIRDTRGRVIAFGGRIIGDGEPKYLNSPDTPLFDKGRTLFNLDRAGPAARKSGRLIVVEGYMDVIALHDAGIMEAVAPLGTALTENQLALLWRVVDTPLLCFDGDAAGQRAALRAALRALPLLKPGKSLDFLTLPPGQDPDDLVRGDGAAAFERLAGNMQPLVDRLWETELAALPVSTPEQRAGLQARLREHARSIEDRDVSQAYEQAFRDRFYTHFRTWNRYNKGASPAPRSPISARKPGEVILTALMAGLLEHPALAAVHGETLAKLGISDPGLARLRELLLDAAMRDPHLDKSALDHNLASAGVGALADEVRRSNRLAFSFTRPGGDSARAAQDLGAVLDVLAALEAIEAALGEATARLSSTAAQEDLDEQQRLRRQKDSLDARLKSLARDDE